MLDNCVDDLLKELRNLLKALGFSTSLSTVLVLCLVVVLEKAYRPILVRPNFAP